MIPLEYQPSGHQKPPNSVQVLTNAMSEMAKNMASISAVPNKPDLAPSGVETSISLGKVANLRTSYLIFMGCSIVALLHSLSLLIKKAYLRTANKIETHLISTWCSRLCMIFCC